MKVTGSSKRKNVSKDDSVVEHKTESGNMVLGQIKLEDLEQEENNNDKETSREEISQHNKGSYN